MNARLIAVVVTLSLFASVNMTKNGYGEDSNDVNSPHQHIGKSIPGNDHVDPHDGVKHGQKHQEKDQQETSHHGNDGGHKNPHKADHDGNHKMPSDDRHRGSGWCCGPSSKLSKPPKNPATKQVTSKDVPAKNHGRNSQNQQTYEAHASLKSFVRLHDSPISATASKMESDRFDQRPRWRRSPITEIHVEKCPKSRQSAADRQSILDIHNEMRSRVTNGKAKNKDGSFLPAATNMRHMKWNCSLEKSAQLWADKCTLNHSHIKYLGENIYMRSGTKRKSTAVMFARAMHAWWVELEKIGMDKNSISVFKMDHENGHFTQVIWAETDSVGCAVTQCKGSDGRAYVVCHYLPAGNVKGKSMYLTTVGRTETTRTNALPIIVASAGIKGNETKSGKSKVKKNETHIDECRKSRRSIVDRKSILDLHNEIRLSVANGKAKNNDDSFLPAAENMRQMKWNCSLEMSAQLWADKCALNHSNIKHLGENIYMRTGPERQSTAYMFTKAMNAWSVELEKSGMNESSISVFEMDYKNGHFTQMIWAETDSVGCAVTQCEGNDSPAYVVCRYFPVGNVKGKPIYLMTVDPSETTKTDALSITAASAGNKGNETKSRKSELKKNDIHADECPKSRHTIADRKSILDLHNEMRLRVTNGKAKNKDGSLIPAATNMRHMKWNCSLERSAQLWADKCTMNHSHVKNLGENIYMRSGTERQSTAYMFAKAMQAWWVELEKIGMDENSVSVFNMDYNNGHFTQIIWAKTDSIGCAVTQCEGSDGPAFVVCHYLPAGNMQGAPMYLTTAKRNKRSFEMLKKTSGNA